MVFPLAIRKVSCERAIGSPTRVLDLTTEFEPATMTVLFGKVGCGKNLLLRLLALMETPDRGEVAIQGESTLDWDEAKRSDFRSHHFGFVFEAPFLLPSFNMIENIAMPLFKLTGILPENAREHTDRVLEFVGMTQCAETSAERLPQWAQLRISLARALVINPVAVFVENPDAVLKNDELIDFLNLLDEARRAFGCCILLTAATRDLAAFGSRAIEMADGAIIRDWAPKKLFS